MNIGEQIRQWAKSINENNEILIVENQQEQQYSSGEEFAKHLRTIGEADRYNDEQTKIFSRMIQDYAEKNGYVFGYYKGKNDFVGDFEKFDDVLKKFEIHALESLSPDFEEVWRYGEYVRDADLGWERAEDYLMDQENEIFHDVFDKFRNGRNDIDFLEYARYLDNRTYSEDEQIPVFYLLEPDKTIYMYKKDTKI